MLDRLRGQHDALTKSERRVADAIVTEPTLLAFGTVAEVAGAAGAGAATVVRLAVKLGYEGFTDLQTAARSEVVGRLRPAAERIRAQPGGDRLAAHLATETDNVRASLGAVDGAALARATERLADPANRIVVASGDASTGVATQFTGELRLLRDHVVQLSGDPVAVHRDLALFTEHTVLVLVDVHRYDRWVLDVAVHASQRDWPIVAVTDGVLSPLATAASEVFVVAAGTVGPFDSHVGILAVLGLIVNETAVRLAQDATHRLDAVERAWRLAGALADG